jgi:predicted MFS family arabinose efflux permease
MKRPWSIARLAPIVVVAVVTLVYNTLPAITGMLARQLRFESEALGAFSSADLLGMAVGALAAIAVMRNTTPRATAVIGLVLLLAADFGSAISGSAAALVPLRALGGVGAGLAVSSGYYMFSLEDQQRNAAASMLAQIAFAVIVITLIPKLVHSWGWRSVFLGLGSLVIPCLLLAREFSPGYEEEVKVPDLPGSPAAPSLIIWLGLISSALFNIAVAVYWTYIERIGAASGITEDMISWGLSISTAMGFLGSVLVIVFGERIHGLMIVASVILNIVGILVSSSPVSWVYVSAISAYYTTLPIYFSAQFSTVMRRAANSRLAAKFTLSIYVGSLGPALGGLVANQYGVLAVRWLVAVLTAVSGVLLWVGFFSSYGVRRLAGDAVVHHAKRHTVLS